MFNTHPLIQILRRLDRLEGFYWSVADQGNIKAGDGLEACIALRMKLFGLDGKDLPPVEPTTPPSVSAVDFDTLSDAALQEVMRAVHNVPIAHQSADKQRYTDPLDNEFE